MNGRCATYVGYVVAILWANPVHAQAPAVDPGVIYRVFLKNGQALPSYGEAARTPDRVIFTLIVGSSVDQGSLQLVSLPNDMVDIERTDGYATTMRAARYAATRGEADYAAMTAEVQRSVERLTEIADPRERLRLAEEAKRKLVKWSQDHYRYRAADIDKLAMLFDDVISELRAGAGESRFTLELHAMPGASSLEPLLPAPNLREAITLTLMAADATDIAAERLTLLSAAAAEVGGVEGLEDLGDEVARRLHVEREREAAYTALTREIVDKTNRAVGRGDVRAVIALKSELDTRHKALGAARDADAVALRYWLDDRLDAARRHRLALDHYVTVRPSLLAYERAIRPVLNGLDGVTAALTAIQDQSGPSYDALVRLDARLERLDTLLRGVTPPTELADIRATLESAITIARHACTQRKLAIGTTSLTLAKEASTAAAGSLLLISTGREQLVERLFPPKAPGAGEGYGEVSPKRAPRAGGH